MKHPVKILAASALALVALSVSADAGQRTVYGPHGGTKTVTVHVDETGASRNVTGTGAWGGTYNATQNCAPGYADCQRSMQATGAYGRTISGSATVNRVPGQSVTTGTVVGPNGGVYNRKVIRSW